MFDVGFSELLIIAVVALLVLGPERLPKAARFAGLWVRRARAQWYSVKSELERELAAEEFKRQFTEPMQELRPQMERLGQDLKQEFDGLDPKLPASVDLAGGSPAIAPTAAGTAAPAVEATSELHDEPPVIGGSPWSIPEVAETSGEPAPSAPAAPDVPAAPDEPTTGDLFGDGARRP
jgi:sec-independent protein translocase protein TatB